MPASVGGRDSSAKGSSSALDMRRGPPITAHHSRAHAPSWNKPIRLALVNKQFCNVHPRNRVNFWFGKIIKILGWSGRDYQTLSNQKFTLFLGSAYVLCILLRQFREYKLFTDPDSIARLSRKNKTLSRAAPL